MAKLNNIPIYRGEAVRITFTMTPVVDVSGWTIVFTLRNNAGDGDPAILTVAATLITPAAGVFRVSLTHAQTVALLGAYAYDVQRTDVGGEAVLSIGQFVVTQEVLYP